MLKNGIEKEEEEKRLRTATFLDGVEKLKLAVRNTGVDGFWSESSGFAGGGTRHVFEGFNAKLVYDPFSKACDFVGELDACVTLRRKIGAVAPLGSFVPLLSAADAADAACLDPWLDAEDRVDDFVRLPDEMANLGSWSLPDRIAKRYYQGGQIAASNEEAMKERGVTHVVAVGNGLETPFEGKGVKYHKIAIWDAEGEDIKQHFDAAVKFIGDALAENDQNVVLTHCQAGISRATTITCAYLMTTYKWSFGRALKHVESRRWVCPNQGFRAQLVALEKELIEKFGTLK